MSVSFKATLRHAADVLKSLVQGAIAIAAAGMAAGTTAAAPGYLPWPTLSIFFGTMAVPQAGMWAQIAVTVLCVLLLIYLPANVRMARLERSHQKFAMAMEDVLRAYRIGHASDRAGVLRFRARLTPCAPGWSCCATTPI
jgi:Flp pilus assembly protein TadB